MRRLRNISLTTQSGDVRISTGEDLALPYRLEPVCLNSSGAYEEISGYTDMKNVYLNINACEYEFLEDCERNERQVLGQGMTADDDKIH